MVQTMVRALIDVLYILKGSYRYSFEQEEVEIICGSEEDVDGCLSFHLEWRWRTSLMTLLLVSCPVKAPEETLELEKSSWPFCG